MDEKHLTRLKAQYYVDTLWPEEVEQATKIQLPKNLFGYFGSKVIIHRRYEKSFFVYTPDQFKNYLDKSQEIYRKNTPGLTYDFDFFPRFAFGPIFESWVTKKGILLIPHEIAGKIDGAKEFKEKIRDRVVYGLEILMR